MVVNERRLSNLYDVIRQIGAISTEDYYIRKYRKKCMLDGIKYVESHDTGILINDTDYVGTSIRLPFSTDPNAIEIWIGDNYIYPTECTWFEENGFKIILLEKEYDTTAGAVQIITNECIIFRNTIIQDEPSEYDHSETIDLTVMPFSHIDNPEGCCYCIADGKFVVPSSHRGANTITFSCPYTQKLDFIIDSSLVGCFQAYANTTLLIDNPYSSKCYCRILADHNPDIFPETRLYPAIRFDHDCFVRVYNDASKNNPYPELTRLLCQPEVIIADDPYEAIGELPDLCDVEITSIDSDADILEKFKQIAPNLPAIHEILPKFPNRRENLLICDNYDFENPSFIKTTVTFINRNYREAIISIQPANPWRDVLFYNGWMYSGYSVKLLKKIGGVWMESSYGTPHYIIEDDVDLNRLTLLKFNTHEDTMIETIDGIDQGMLLLLHKRIRQFYRNLLVIKRIDFSHTEDLPIHTSYTEPDRKDVLWFNLLTTSDPLLLNSAPVEAIYSHRLDPNDIPDSINGAIYSLDLDNSTGPEKYTSVYHTYFELTDALQEFLVLQDLNYIDAPSDTITVADGWVNNPLTTLSLIPDQYINTSTGRTVNMADIANMTKEEKRNLILEYITDERDTNIKTIWNSYLDRMDEEILNMAVAKVLVLDVIYTGTISESSSIDLPIPREEAIRHNVSQIVHSDASAADIGEYWLDIPGISMQDYVGDVIYDIIIECGLEIPDGETYLDQYGVRHGTLMFNYGDPHVNQDDVSIRVSEPKMPVYGYGFVNTPENGDIWYKFTKEIRDNVFYHDEDTMVISVNEHLYAVEFSHDNVTLRVFDDILMNFNGQLGIRYRPILADLVKSGIIGLDKLMIFYHRLITPKDNFDPRLARLNDGSGWVISQLDIPDNMIIAYSSNIGRLHIDYSGDDVTNMERGMAYKMVLDFSRLEFSFMEDRMALFVNGRYVPRSQFIEYSPGKLQLLSFDEIISCVDILYPHSDIDIAKLRRIAMDSRMNEVDEPESIQRPSKNYKVMEPIINANETARGFYDILLQRLIFSGALMDQLQYLKDNPDEADMYIRDIKRAFANIDDNGIFGLQEDDGRIIIPGFGDTYKYQIGVA